MEQRVNEALVDRFILFCKSRKLVPSMSRTALISRVNKYALLRSRGFPASRIKWRPNILVLPEWTDVDELEWITWLDVYCSLSNWETEVLAPVFGSCDPPDWAQELHGFLSGWIQRIRKEEEL
jgi:hypothetical protein